MTATNLDRYEKLLASFKELAPSAQSDPTILEILGYPYSKWENAYSNTLAFFLDPEREHDFGSLFLESLLSLAKGKAERQDTQEVEVSREVRTATNKQIDLVAPTRKCDDPLFLLIRRKQQRKRRRLLLSPSARQVG